MMTGSGTLLIDGHVHLHPSFDPTGFLNAAERNFLRAAKTLDGGGGAAGCLIFTEDPRERSFADVLDRLDRAGEGWKIAPGDEEISAWARRGSEPRILLLAGRQLPTREGLEVLALCSDEAFASREPLEGTISAVRAAGAVPVVPWGFGKWWYGRGDLLRTLVDEGEPRTFFLGDQPGRPRSGPRPELFARARQRGVLTLSGSDPLPFPRHQERAGSYGFAVPLELPGELPGAAVRQALLGLASQPPGYGRGAGLREFLRDQLGMQLRKRRAGRVSDASPSR
jgi:hypothetical protein